MEDFDEEISTFLENEIHIKIHNTIQDIHKNFRDDFKKALTDPNSKSILKIIKKKYSFLKDRRLSLKTNPNKARGFIYRYLHHSEIKDKFEESDIQTFYKWCIWKIKGIYKHAQSFKTGFCNGKILSHIDDFNFITMCITKNTLEANAQWLLRLIKHIKEKFPCKSPNEMILLISSKCKNRTLKDSVTHCKNADEAWGKLKNKNSYKIIFVCGNSTRWWDVLEIAESYLNQKKELQKKIRIFHDEAHNKIQGTPAYRHIIENLLLLPNIDSYIPVTASIGKIVDEENQLWQSKNLEKFAMNYTPFNDSTSDDPKYSSCKEAIQITFEELKKNKSWKNYVKDKIPKKHMKKCYGESFSKEKIEEKRVLGFTHNFPLIKREPEAINYAFNCMRLNEFFPENPIYVPNEFNLHIVSTPLRCAVTRWISYKYSKMPYNPYVLAIYGDKNDMKYHIFRKGKCIYKIDGKSLDEYMGDGEFNEKLLKLIKYFKMEDPFIVIGNYEHTGESLSFVHSEYGTVRSNICLISTDADKAYQQACRLNYMIKRFIEENPGWKKPEKILIGEKVHIDNALMYEKMNDERVKNLKSRENEDNIIPQINMYIGGVQEKNTEGTTGIPIKLDVDFDDERIKKVMKILLKKRKTDENKLEIKKLLEEAIQDEDSECELIDISGKFSWDLSCSTIRTYTKERKSNKGYWKFTNYQRHHQEKVGFINSRGDIKKGAFEMLTCLDTYRCTDNNGSVIKDKNGKPVEMNKKRHWWIGYKY
jgi:hypothetical protein